jgi:hypothetical protein
MVLANVGGSNEHPRELRRYRLGIWDHMGYVHTMRSNCNKATPGSTAARRAGFRFGRAGHWAAGPPLRCSLAMPIRGAASICVFRLTIKHIARGLATSRSSVLYVSA